MLNVIRISRYFLCNVKPLKEINKLYSSLASLQRLEIHPCLSLSANFSCHWQCCKFQNVNLNSSRFSHSEGDGDIAKNEPEKKLSLFQRFKQMYRDYWYVLIPVHIVTSSIWFGSFYYAAKSGVDIGALLDSLNLSESLSQKLKSHGNSTAGYLAISYALYKIFTPLRYMVTLGGTTFMIRYLTKRGYIQPIPKQAELRKMLQNKKDSLRQSRDNLKTSIMNKISRKS